MEQGRLKVEAAGKWVAHLPQVQAGNVSARNVDIKFRILAGNPAIR